MTETDDPLPSPSKPKASLGPGHRSSPVVWQRHVRQRATRSTTEPADTTTAAAPLKPAAARLSEWHAMDTTARSVTWKALVAWVTWLHDRYELGIEERLPPCWAQHPGLIEELVALKAWREEIYQAPQPSGQAARYWHAELRQTINAALTFYAAGCRAGHQGATDLAREDEERQARWAGADHTAGIPPHLLRPPAPAATAPSRTDSHLWLSNATMGTHRLTGQVTTLSETVTDIVRHDNAWWMPDPQGGWLRVTDHALDATLTRRAHALALADQAVRRHRATTTGPQTTHQQ